MKNIMLDLETMGTDPNSAIVAIGAVAFNLNEPIDSDDFYRKVTLRSSMQNKGVIDPSTILWWMNQSQSAREEIVTADVDILEALQDFTTWVDDLRVMYGGIQIWGNGSDFDNVILASAYRNANMDAPWKFWENRCYRTMVKVYPGTKIMRKGTHHNALDDARTQADHLIRIHQENFAL